MKDEILRQEVYYDTLFQLVKRKDDYVVFRNTKIVEMGMSADTIFPKYEKTVKSFLNGKEEGGEQKYMSEQEKARAKAESLRPNTEEQTKIANDAKAIVKSQLAALRANPTMAALYKGAAKKGAANLGGASYPYLRQHSSSNSLNNELADGTQPRDGEFYYKPTKQAWSEFDAHILTISPSFYVINEDRKTKEKYLRFQQLVAGYILEGGEPKPFIFFIGGVRLQPMWKFAKEASQLTRSRDWPIPMFALLVHVTGSQVKTENGFKWVANFNIEREAGEPKLIEDEGEFVFYRDSVDYLEAECEQIIADHEATDEAIAEAGLTKPERATAGAVPSAAIVDAEEDITPSDPPALSETAGEVDPEKIPF
jgi:hypothetical protein